MHISAKTCQHVASQVLPAVLFAALIGVTFVSKRPNWGVPPPPRVWTKFQVPKDRAFFGAIDSPMTAQADGYLPISGWAAATSETTRVVRVEIYVDRNLVATVQDFMPRPDVAAVFNRPSFEISGWRCVISTQNIKPGEHNLRLRMLGSDANSDFLPVKKLTILE